MKIYLKSYTAMECHDFSPNVVDSKNTSTNILARLVKADASMSSDKLTRHSQNSFRRFRYFSTVHAFLPSHFVYTTQLPLYPLKISLPDTLFWNVLKNSHKKERRYYWCFTYRGHVYLLQIGFSKKIRTNWVE